MHGGGQGPGGGGSEELVLKGAEFFGFAGGRVLEKDGGDGCTAGMH